MTKVPQPMMRMMRSTMIIPRLRGFGNFNSLMSTVLSGIFVLLLLCQQIKSVSVRGLASYCTILDLTLYHSILSGIPIINSFGPVTLF
jgi:hypothetical protein